MPTETQTYLLRLGTSSLAEANYYAEELRETLLDASPDIIVQRNRDDQTTQDFGSTLILVLGAPAIVAAVNAIGNWLQRRTNASITIETSEKKIIAHNIDSKDAVRLIQLMLTQGGQKDK